MGTQQDHGDKTAGTCLAQVGGSHGPRMAPPLSFWKPSDSLAHDDILSGQTVKSHRRTKPSASLLWFRVPGTESAQKQRTKRTPSLQTDAQMSPGGALRCAPLPADTSEAMTPATCTRQKFQASLPSLMLFLLP